MNFATITGALRIVLDQVSGIPGGVTQESEQSFYIPQIGPGAPTADFGTGASTQARIDFAFISTRGLGQDEQRNVYDPDVEIVDDTYAGPGAPLGGVIISVHGQREIVVQVKCECSDLRDGFFAQTFLERMRTRLTLPSVHDALDLVGIAIAEIGATQDLTYTNPDNMRRVSAAAFDIIFNAADTAADEPVTTIEIVTVPVPEEA